MRARSAVGGSKSPSRLALTLAALVVPFAAAGEDGAATRAAPGAEGKIETAGTVAIARAPETPSAPVELEPAAGDPESREPQAPGATAASPMTVARAIEIALEQNPELLEARERVPEIRALRMSALAQALPQVNGEASSSRDRDPGFLNSPNFESLAGSPGFDTAFLEPIPVTTYEYKVSLSQAIYSFGKIASGLRALALQQERAGQEALSRALDIARDTAIACLDVALADARVEVLETERLSRERQVAEARDFLEIGAGTRLQVLQAEAALAGVRPRRLAAEGQGREARARLNRLLGRPALEPVQLQRDLLVVEALPSVPGIETLVRMIDARPELVAIDLELRELEARRRVIRADRLPELRFSGAWGIRAIQTANLFDDRYSSWSAGLFMEFPIWDGHERRGQLLQNASQARQAELRRRARRSQLLEELVSAIAAYESALGAAEAASIAAEQSDEAQRVAAEEFRYGAATTLDVLEAERTLTEARLRRLEATRDALAALYRATTLVGRLPGDSPTTGETP